MSDVAHSRVSGLLGVGFDHQDGQIRITQAEDYQIFMGSGETHRILQDVCRKIDEHIAASGRPLNDYTPEEFMELMQEIL